MSQKQAEIIGMTLTWFAISAPLLLALWFALSGQYQWLAVTFPLLLALGAPVAYVLSGFVGPKVGRRVLTLFGPRQQGKKPQAGLKQAGHSYFSADAAERQASLEKSEPAEAFGGSMTITPNQATVRVGTSAPTVLVYAHDDVAVRVQEALSVTCDVTLAVNSSDALTHIQSGNSTNVVFDSSVIANSTNVDVFLAARATVGVEHVYVVFKDRYRQDIKGWELVKKLHVSELETLAHQLAERR